MYTSYFGLKENPFNLTPDPRYLFLSNNNKALPLVNSIEKVVKGLSVMIT